MPNRLASETSPYLKQHANNPVDWYPWGPEALTKAREENKLIIVSVGYSACHWCHVMEHESFEDNEVARIMNDHFVSIKVDREERPDIDQIYMQAVQLTTGRGGWPMNVVCLPDQRPIYAGTYFPKEVWMDLLQNLAGFWQEKPEEARDYASRLTAGISEGESLHFSNDEQSYTEKDLEAIFEQLKAYFDRHEGGYQRYPKFPMPNNWQFVLRYAHFMNSSEASDAVYLTLKKMANGGIFDHIGGGFARYSVDPYWHVPHFEKMLYDNAQLISLYSEAFLFFREPQFREVVFETVDWLKREMLSSEGGFYSALDADSEGVEGKYYTFGSEEIKEILGNESQLFCDVYGITEDGNWEEAGTNVLMRSLTASQIAEKYASKADNVEERIKEARKRVFEYREHRIKPALDNKIIASWNGLALKALTDAYKAFGEATFLDLAIKNGTFIRQHLIAGKGMIKRMYSETARSSVRAGFLDDFAFVIDGFIGLYEVTFDESWLNDALQTAEFVLANFYDPGTGIFYYTSQTAEELIARKHEIQDNVIPASNSAMAMNLFKLGHFYGNDLFLQQADEMLSTVFPSIKEQPGAFSNWAMLLVNKIFGLYEVAITGPSYEAARGALEQQFIPNKITLGGVAGSLPLLDGRFGPQTNIFICKDKICQLPVTTVDDALAIIRQ